MKKLEERDILVLRRPLSQNEETLRSFGIFYTALLSDAAVRLYWHLYAFYELGSYPENVEELRKNLGVTMIHLSEILTELENIGLIKVYEKTEEPYKTVCLEIRTPKTAEEFLDHPVLSRAYLSRAGLPLYTKVRKELPPASVSLEGFTDVTESDMDFFASDWNSKNEEDYRKVYDVYDLKDYTPDNDFDYRTFFAECSERVFPSAFRTKENLDAIGTTAMIFGIDPKRMVAHVGQSMIKQGRTLTAFDSNKLYMRCKNDLNGGNAAETGSPYDKSPAEFLRARQNGVRKLSDSDARLLDDLVRIWKLPIPVCNVLIEYVLDTQDGEFKRSIAEKIASSFVRSDVKTAKDALKKIGNSRPSRTNTPKPEKKTVRKKETEPVDEKEDSGTDKEREELLKLLKG